MTRRITGTSNQGCRASCRYCGSRTGLILNIAGLGILKRRHEDRCFRALQQQRAQRHSESLRRVASSADGGDPNAEVQQRSHHNADDASLLGGSLFARRAVQGSVATGAAVAAVMLEAPLIAVVASVFFLASEIMWWRRRRQEFNLSRPVVECSPAVVTNALPELCNTGGATGSTAFPKPPNQGGTHVSQNSRVSKLLREVRFEEALYLATQLPAMAAGTGPEDVLWLQRLGTRVSRAELRLHVPPEGSNWSGPVVANSEAESWDIQFWWNWSDRDVITTVMKTTLTGTLVQAFALLYEGDLQKNWLPCVIGGIASWSETFPALTLDIWAKVPVLPMIFSTMLHRAALPKTLPDGNRAILLLDWTPPPEDIVGETYCGMNVPPAPPRSFRGELKGAFTLLKTEPDGRVSMTSVNDVGFPRKLCPEFVLKRFFKISARLGARKLAECLRNFEERGYSERVSADRQGVYRKFFH